MKLEWNHPIIKAEVGGDDMELWELADFERAARTMTVAPWSLLCAMQKRPWWRVFNIYDLTRYDRRYSRPDQKPWEITAMAPGRKRDELCAQLMRRYRTSIREILSDYSHWADVQREGWVAMGWEDVGTREVAANGRRSPGQKRGCLVVGFLWLYTVLCTVLKLLALAGLLLVLLIVRLAQGVDGEKQVWRWVVSYHSVKDKASAVWRSIAVEHWLGLAVMGVMVAFVCYYQQLEQKEREQERQKQEQAERRRVKKEAKERREREKREKKQREEARWLDEAMAARRKKQRELRIIDDSDRVEVIMECAGFKELDDARGYVLCLQESDKETASFMWEERYKKAMPACSWSTFSMMC